MERKIEENTRETLGRSEREVAKDDERRLEIEHEEPRLDFETDVDDRGGEVDLPQRTQQIDT